MPYTKRWELMHMLGGGCAECGNQNCYDLEIDHIHNDGHGDRDFYANLETRYVQNPKRAKQRLQLLCKICHRQKHCKPHKAGDYRKKRMMFFMDTLRFLETVEKQPVSETRLVSNLKLSSLFNQYDTSQYIRLMLRQASIYESKRGHYNTV